MTELSDIRDCLTSATDQIARERAAWFELLEMTPEAFKLMADICHDKGKLLDPAILNGDQETLLHAAAREGRVAYIEVLVAYGAYMEVSCSKHCTAISVSVKAVCRDAFELLLSLGLKAGSPMPGGMIVMHHAASFGSCCAFQCLIALGAGEEEALGPQLKSRHGLKACHLGAAHADVFRLMREAGWNLMAKDKSGRMPLHHAASSDSAESVLFLMEAGADLQVTDFVGMSARMLGRSRTVDLVRSFEASQCARAVAAQ